MGESAQGPSLEEMGIDEPHPLSEQEYIEAQTINNSSFNPEEFKFHKERFKRKKEAYTQKQAAKGRAAKFFTGNQTLSEVDMAHEEALGDDAEYERRQLAEYKDWEGRLKIVIENLIKKRDDPEGEGKNIRPLLLVMGGGMKGAYGAGQVIALGRMGFREVFDTVVGISSGAADAAYFLSAKEGDDIQTLRGTSIYNENLASKKFFDKRRLPNLLRRKKFTPVMDVGYAVDIIKNDPDKALDVEEIKKKRPEFWVQATDPETKQPRLINAKEVKEGIAEALHGSMAVPFVYRKEIVLTDPEHGETLNIDGAFKPFPIEDVVDKFHPTDVLVLPQMRFERTDLPFMTKVKDYFTLGFIKAIPKLGSSAAVQKWALIDAENRKTLDKLKTMHVNVAVAFAPEAGLNPVSGDADEVKLGAWQAATDLLKRFGEGEKVKDLTLL